MVILKSIAIALSTYSAIPMAQFDWDRDSMAYSIGFLPLVGVVLALAMNLWFRLCGALAMGEVLAAAGAVVLAIALTGGIHMDGFCDSADALGSRQPPEKCLEIMKDSRAGAFAVISCGLYLVLTLGLWAELYRQGWASGASAIFVLSRAAAVVAAVTCKSARPSGMLAAFTASAKGQVIVGLQTLWAAAALAAMVLGNDSLKPVIGLCGALALWWRFYIKMTTKRFGGVTGDTAGFFVQLSELVMLAAYLFTMLIESL